MNARVPAAPTFEPELSLCLLEDFDRPEPRRLAGVGIASIVLNFFFLIGIGTLANIQGTPAPPEPHAVDLARATPLIFPSELTQKTPNRAEVSKEVHLDDLLPQPAAPAQKRIFTPPPAPKAGSPAPPAPAPTVEPPSIRVAQAAPPPPSFGTAPDIPAPPVPAPPAQAQQKPKLAFETPGLSSAPTSPRPAGAGRIAAPRSSIEETVRSVSRNGPGGLVLGDSVDDGGLGQALGQTPSPGRQASQVELLSDPQGVDFKPYLIRVLAAVRRNWFAVIPESARFGRRGKVVIQFSINRTGSVPKLVIAMPSGTEGLDRAAVAGISASNPFPPLPAEFKGDQIRVQLVFAYNVPSR